MRLLTKLLMRLRGGQRGFTLMETVVGLGLAGLVLPLMATGMFQAWGVERTQRHDVVATVQLDNATRWFTSDALNAQLTDLSDGAAPVSSVSLSWTDASDVSHTASYNREGTNLVRTFDGTSLTVARGVVSIAFSCSGNTIFATLEVQGARGETKSLTLRSYLRVTWEL